MAKKNAGGKKTPQKKTQRTAEELVVDVVGFITSNLEKTGEDHEKMAELLSKSKDFTKLDLSSIVASSMMTLDKALKAGKGADELTSDFVNELVGGSGGDSESTSEVANEDSNGEKQGMAERVYSMSPEVLIPNKLLTKRKPPLGSTRKRNCYFLEFLFKNGITKGITLDVLKRVGYIQLPSDPLNGRSNENLHDSGYSLVASSKRTYLFDLVEYSTHE